MAKPKLTHLEIGIATFWLAMWVLLSLLLGYAIGGDYTPGAPGFAGTHPLLWALIPLGPGILVWAVIVLIVRFAFAASGVRMAVLIAVPFLALLWGLVFLFGA
jgi:hypothetical protein